MADDLRSNTTVDAYVTQPAVDTPRDGPSVAAGVLIDHYQVVRLIGHGGMGEIYLARDTKLGRRVALKIVQPELLGSRIAIERFRFEAQTTARFNHPNIVAIHGVGEFRGAPYVALEYVEGQDLRDRLAERQPSQQEALRIARATAEALCEAHAHNVLHRDLKPDNVIIGHDGRLRVVDFGLAKSLDVAELDSAGELDDRWEAVAPLESSKGLKGTPAYMSPEQWQSLDCGPAADIWALGVMMHEMLTGLLPYELDGFNLASSVTSPEPVDRIDGQVDVPPMLSELVAACLQKDPGDRPPASDVVDVLNRLVDAEARGIGGRTSPFRGLLPFTEQHAALFFGREREVAAFAERARGQPVLPVVGPSGAGKTSFVRAGVIPRLREQERWVVVAMRPGSRPFEALAARLLRPEAARSIPSMGTSQDVSLTDPGDERSAAELQQVADGLRNAPAKLWLKLRALAEQRRAKVLFFVDQLEELFTLTDDEETRRRFMLALCTAADDPHEPVRVAFTVRDDFLGRLVTGPEVREALRDVTVLQRPTRDVLVEMVAAPVKAVGYRFDDDSLVVEMANAVGNEPAGLPLLQFAAQKLWEQRDPDRKLLLRSAYEAMGGVEGALAMHADGVLEGFSAEEVTLAREMLLRMVTPERTRKVVTRDDALRGLAAGADEVLARLSQARLVTVRKGRGTSDARAKIELAHESLAVRWHSLARWIDEGREELTFLAETSQAARIWDKHGQQPAALWQGDALDEALRALDRCTTEVPALVRDFLTASRARATRHTRRRRTLVVSALVVLATIATALGFQTKELSEQRQRADEQSQQAQTQKAEALTEGAKAAFQQGNVLEARAKLRTGLEEHDSASARALWWQLTRHPLLWKREMSSPARSVAASPDSNRLVVAMDDGTVHIIHRQTLQTRILRGHTDQVMAASISRAGHSVASGGLDGRVLAWDLRKDNQHRVLMDAGDATLCVDVDEAGNLVAAGGRGGKVRVWNAKSGERLHQLDVDGTAVRSVDISPQGRLLAAVTSGGSLAIWQLKDGRIVEKRNTGRGVLAAVRFHPDGSRVAVGGRAQEIQLFTLSPFAADPSLTSDAGTTGLSFDSDGRRLIATSMAGAVVLHDVASGKVLRRFHGHTSAVYGAAFSSEGRSVATASFDKTIRFWNLEPSEHPTSTRGHQGGVFDVSFHPDGSTIASASVDRSVRLWDVVSGRELGRIGEHSSEVWTVDHSPDGKLLASGSSDNTVRVWELASGKQRLVLEGHNDDINSVRFSPDGKLIASAAFDNTVRVWSAADGSLLRELRDHDSGVFRVAFNDDGSQLLTGSSDTKARLWDLKSGELVHVHGAHNDRVRAVAFSPTDGRMLTAGDDRRLMLWRTNGDDGMQSDHPYRIHAAAFHPDGRRLVTAGADGGMRMWDLAKHEHVEIRGHRRTINGARFDATGSRWATASTDGTVRVWGSATGRAHWRAPILVRAPARLLTHQGWLALGPRAARAATAPRRMGKRLQESLEQRARYAIRDAAPDAPLCVQTADDRIEVWNVGGDELAFVEQLADIQQLLALTHGCMVRDRDGARLIAADGGSKLLSLGRVAAISVGAKLHVVSDQRIRTFSIDGSETSSVAIGPGVVMVAPQNDDWLFVGYRDGVVDLVAQQDGSRRQLKLDQVPASAPLRALAGPMGTIIVGYADGTVGIWDGSDGERLIVANLHGPIVHLLHEDGVLHAATELGDHLSWDLRGFERGRCELLREVWSAVPVAWRDGHAQATPAPPEHPCAE